MSDPVEPAAGSPAATPAKRPPVPTWVKVLAVIDALWILAGIIGYAQPGYDSFVGVRILPVPLLFVGFPAVGALAVLVVTAVCLARAHSRGRRSGDVGIRFVGNVLTAVLLANIIGALFINVGVYFA